MHNLIPGGICCPGFFESETYTCGGNMKNKFRRLAAALSAAVLGIYGMTDAITVLAEESDVLYELEDMQTGTAEQENQHAFTVEKAGEIFYYITTTEPAGITVTLYDEEGKAVKNEDSPFYIDSTDALWTTDDSGNAMNCGSWDLKKGDYSCGVTFDTDHTYSIRIVRGKATAEISDAEAEITVEFTKKLSVDGEKVKGWFSDKETIAVVDDEGMVTAKKIGKAVISARCENGQTERCVVNVKENKYTGKKLSVNDVPEDDCAMAAYSAKFDAKGNLVIQTRFVNHISHKVAALKEIQVVVKDERGRVVGRFSKMQINRMIPSGSTIDFNFIISRSNLKKKKADLRKCKIKCDGTYVYYY